MKKIVMTMVALLTMTAAVAQSENGNGQRKAPKQMTPTEMTTRMAKDLKLTDEQKQKVQALNEEYKDYLGGPGMGRHRGPRPDAQTGATTQQGQQEQQAQQGQQGRQRPQFTDEQKARMKQHRAKREEYDQKLKLILTDEQYKSYQKQQKRHGRRRAFEN